MKRLGLIFLTGLIVVSGSIAFTQLSPESATPGADMADLGKKSLPCYVVPFIYQEDHIGTGSQSGFADSTASDNLPRADKWCLGSPAIVLRHECALTYGFFADQVLSFAREDSRSDANSLSIQPLLSHTNGKHTAIGINSETLHEWESEERTIPVNAVVTQRVKTGQMPVRFQFGIRAYLKPTDGPYLGLRVDAPLVFPT